MGSDKRSGAPGAAGAARGPRPVITGPGSVNRGFESVDPERQREADAEGGSAADQGGKMHKTAARTARVRRAPATGGGVKQRGAGGSRAKPGEGEDEEGGSS